MPNNLPPSLFAQALQMLLPYLEQDARAFVLPVIRNSRIRYKVEWAGSANTLGNYLLDLLSHDDLIALLGEVPDEARKPTIASLCEQIANCRPVGTLPNEDPERSYARSLISFLSQPRYQIDKRFVRLSILVDQGVEAQTRFVPQPRPEPLNDLRDVLAETQAHPALVLLGAPGAGKSTLLRRLQLDLAHTALEDVDARLTFYVPLNKYPLDEIHPARWLAAEWARENPSLSFEALMQQGRLILLLDALNEMKRRDRDDLTQRIDQWRDFLPEFTQCPNRAIVTCRSLDYSLLLDSPGLTVRQCNVEPMSAEQIREFLQVYVPGKAAATWDKLKGDTAQLKLYGTPFFLKLLTEQLGPEGEIPNGRAALFTGLIRNALSREIANRNALLTETTTEALFTEQDRRQLPQLRDPFALPERGPLLPSLSALAYGMQKRSMQRDRLSEDEDALQVRVSEAAARDLIAHTRARDILDAGVSLNVLEEDLRSSDDILFYHQLLQEYFAARQLTKEGGAGALVQSEWRAGAIRPSLSETLAGLDMNTPLPPAPATGWEETVLLAAAMHPNPDAFVRGLMEANLPLAGRCAAAPDSRVSEALKDELCSALIARSQDRAADLRTRIAAGEALGQLGDPRFERRTGPHGDYLLPPLIKIPVGSYMIGDDSGTYDREKPAHPVEIAAFELGQFPVTNAEYALFMQAGGYAQEQWWETDAAKAWRLGEGSNEGIKESYRGYRKSILQMSDDAIQDLVRQNRVTPEQAEVFIDWKKITDEEVDEQLAGWFPEGKRYSEPEYWTDTRFNNPAQPIVGITWHEARAYCAWLSAQTGWVFRLPTEAEWEVACRGQAGRRYAYGDEFEVTAGNTFESHLRRSTPVGIYLDGATPSGLMDMTGNTWDWTSSLLADYPYDDSPAHEDVKATGARVLRGGSWVSSQVDARGSYRNYRDPGDRDYDLGFRVVCVRPLIL